MSNNVNTWCMTQAPSRIGSGFAMPASVAGFVAPSAAALTGEATRDRHAVATKQIQRTPVWSPPT